MADPKTVTIVDTDFKSGFRIINESDFDASVHKVFDPNAKPAAKVKVPAAETKQPPEEDAGSAETKQTDPAANKSEPEPDAKQAPAPRRRASS